MLRSAAFLRGVPSLHTEAAGTAPPDAFGTFRVLHQIGAGTLGPVFRAYEPDVDRLVAVKLFRLDLPPDRVHRFVAELDLLVAADLTHPAIAAPAAAGISGVAAYLVQDFVAAESLDIVLRLRAATPPAEIVRVVTHVAGALDSASAARIVHGALHPRDVLVSPDDVRVTGLGVARALERVGVTAPVRRPYTAPERAGGRAWDRRADVYSLAALAFEMLWGRRPTARGPRAVDGLVDLPGVDMPALRAILVRGLAETFGDRFDTAVAFADALKLALADASLPPEKRPAMPTLFDIDTMTAEPIGVPRGEPLEAFLHEPTPEGLATRQRGAGELQPERGSATSEPPPAKAASAPRPLERPAKRRPSASAAPLATVALPREETPLLRESRLEPEAPDRVDPPILALDSTRSAVWPLVLALGVGVAVGFAGGYGLAFRERPQPSPGVEATPTPAPAPPASPQVIPAATPPPALGDPLVGRPAAADAPGVPQGVDQPRAPVATGRAGQGTLAREPATPGPPPRAASRPRQVPPERPVAPPRVVPVGAATLVVETRPAGATVWLDGTQVGTTPLSFESARPGTHTVRLELDGYNRWEARVTIAAGVRQRVAASLERAP